MSKRRLIIILSVVLLILGIKFSINRFGKISLSEHEVQSKIDEKLPFVSNGIILKGLEVDFNNDILTLTATLDGSKWGQNFHAVVTSIGVPYYNNNSEGLFYFRPEKVRVEKLDIKGDSISSKVEQFIDKYIDSEKINQHSGVIGNRAEKWFHSSVAKLISTTLKNVPIYKLPDNFNGRIARVMLKSVEVNNDRLILNLSFQKLTELIIVWTIIIMFILLICLIYSPI